MQNLKILGLQTNIHWDDPRKNREQLGIKILNHVDGHHLVILPETFTTGFPKFPDFRGEPHQGETLEWMAEMAGQTQAVITGSYIAGENGHYTNRLIWMLPDGTHAQYDKRHVFSMAGENQVIQKGKEQLIVELNGWKIRPMICYDLRFPVWSKNRMTAEGDYAYDLALYIANWPSLRSYPWTQLLIARAIENLAFVTGINRIGHDPHGIYYDGHSMVIDPKGKILEEAGEGRERALDVELSYSELHDFRQKFNVGPDWDAFHLTE